MKIRVYASEAEHFKTPAGREELHEKLDKIIEFGRLYGEYLRASGKMNEFVKTNLRGADLKDTFLQHSSNMVAILAEMNVEGEI